jgi:hypothetical protein
MRNKLNNKSYNNKEKISKYKKFKAKSNRKNNLSRKRKSKIRILKEHLS